MCCKRPKAGWPCCVAVLTGFGPSVGALLGGCGVACGAAADCTTTGWASVGALLAGCGVACGTGAADCTTGWASVGALLEGCWVACGTAAFASGAFDTSSSTSARARLGSGLFSGVKGRPSSRVAVAVVEVETWSQT